MDVSPPQTADPVRARLLKAALECFLADDYHRVTTRRIAAMAGANVSMIRYYFGSKEGLYEEAIRDTLQPLLERWTARCCRRRKGSPIS
ncbi:TetR family transcriptional regulator [Methylogaea oryzae]|uniref:TetR family transcriptional regulator n=1 Tax=Methylogaea oryzae TaxID=1295382 RepID=UPI000ACCB21E|nr:TetR family transcriptional regulator [Methylogaea oryzae]